MASRNAIISKQLNSLLINFAIVEGAQGSSFSFRNETKGISTLKISFFVRALHAYSTHNASGQRAWRHNSRAWRGAMLKRASWNTATLHLL